jgi:hypothetical protein
MKVTTESLPDFGPSDGVARCNGAPRALGGGVIHKGATNPFILVSATGPLAESQIVTATDPGDVAEYWYAATYFVDDGIPYKTVAICE